MASFSHMTKKEAERNRDSLTPPRSHSSQVAKLGWQPVFRPQTHNLLTTLRKSLHITAIMPAVEFQRWMANKSSLFWKGWNAHISPFLPRTVEHGFPPDMLTRSSLLQGVWWWCPWLNSWHKFTTPRPRPPWRDCAATCPVRVERAMWRGPPLFLPHE